MASVIRWHDPSEVVLNKFCSPKNQNNETAGENDREIQDISHIPKPRKEGIYVNYIVIYFVIYINSNDYAML